MVLDCEICCDAFINWYWLGDSTEHVQELRSRDQQLIDNAIDLSNDRRLSLIPSQQIVPGISLSPSGQATVDPALTSVLIDIAIKIDDTSRFPVDVEHVLAAIVLAAQNGDLDPATVLSSDDEPLVSVLAQHVETVFKKFGGKVGADD